MAAQQVQVLRRTSAAEQFDLLRIAQGRGFTRGLQVRQDQGIMNHLREPIEDIAKVEVRMPTIRLGTGRQRVQDRRRRTAVLATQEQPCLAAHREGLTICSERLLSIAR